MSIHCQQRKAEKNKTQHKEKKKLLFDDDLVIHREVKNEKNISTVSDWLWPKSTFSPLVCNRIIMGNQVCPISTNSEYMKGLFQSSRTLFQLDTCIIH